MIIACRKTEKVILIFISTVFFCLPSSVASASIRDPTNSNNGYQLKRVIRALYFPDEFVFTGGVCSTPDDAPSTICSDRGATSIFNNCHCRCKTIVSETFSIYKDRCISREKGIHVCW